MGEIRTGTGSPYIKSTTAVQPKQPIAKDTTTQTTTTGKTSSLGHTTDKKHVVTPADDKKLLSGTTTSKVPAPSGHSTGLSTTSTESLIAISKNPKETLTSTLDSLQKIENSHSSVPDGHSVAGDGHGDHVELAYGSHASIGLSLSGGIGGSYGIATAKLGVGVEASMTIEKSFGQGPSYLGHVDLDAKVEGELSIKTMLMDAGVDFEAKTGFTGGMGFSTLGEAKGFAKNLAKTLALSQGLPDTQAAFEAAAAKLVSDFKKYSYSGTHTEISGSVKGELKGIKLPSFVPKGASLSASQRTDINTYNGQTVQDKQSTFEGKLEWGHHKEIGVKYTHQESRVKKADGTYGPPATRDAVHIKIPTAMVAHGLDHLAKGGKHPFTHMLDKMGEPFKKEFIAQFKALNPESAAMNTAQVLEVMNGIMSDNYDIFSKTTQASKVSGGSEIVIGIDRSTQPGKPGAHWALELGIEGKMSGSATATSGAFYGSMKAKAEIEIAAAITLPFH